MNINKQTLDKLLKKEEREKIIFVDNPTPDEICMEDYALEKAKAICKAARKLDGWGGLEWYGFLVSPDYKTITDVILEKNEQNQGAYTKISPESIARAAEPLRKKDLDIVGWIHSHANMAVWFSGTDDRNIETVLNSVSLNTRVHSKNEEIVVDNLGLILNGSSPKSDESLIVKIDGSELAKITKVKLLEPTYIGWSYNIVINDKGEHHQEIAVSEETLLTKQENTYRKEVELKIIPTDKKVDLEQIEKEVKDKIKRPWHSFIPKMGWGRDRQIYIPGYGWQGLFHTPYGGYGRFDEDYGGGRFDEEDRFDEDEIVVGREAHEKELDYRAKKLKKLEEDDIKNFFRNIRGYIEYKPDLITKIKNLYSGLQGRISKDIGADVKSLGKNPEVIDRIITYKRENIEFATLIDKINSISGARPMRVYRLLENYLNGGKWKKDTTDKQE